ncbi:MAG: hypothetical protein ACR2IK_03705 [Chloroflexota bacterium]
MNKRETADNRTLQDDRAELGADPGEGSALTEDQGGPLAEENVVSAEEAVTAQASLGGAPIAVTTEDLRTAAPGGSVTTSEDRDIGD